MSRIYDALRRENVDERLAAEIDRQYVASRETVTQYLERLSTACWDAAGEFGAPSREAYQRAAAGGSR